MNNNLTAENLLSNKQLKLITRKKDKNYYFFNMGIKGLKYLNDNIILATNLDIVNAVYLYIFDDDKETISKALSKFSPVFRLPKRVLFPDFQINQYHPIWEVKIGRLTETKLNLVIKAIQDIDNKLNDHLNDQIKKHDDYWDYVESCIDSYISDYHDRDR